jgi:hypothetical protein
LLLACKFVKCFRFQLCHWLEDEAKLQEMQIWQVLTSRNLVRNPFRVVSEWRHDLRWRDYLVTKITIQNFLDGGSITLNRYYLRIFLIIIVLDVWPKEWKQIGFRRTKNSEKAIVNPKMSRRQQRSLRRLSCLDLRLRKDNTQSIWKRYNSIESFNRWTFLRLNDRKCTWVPSYWLYVTTSTGVPVTIMIRITRSMW